MAGNAIANVQCICCSVFYALIDIPWKGVAVSVVTSHVSQQIVLHGDAAPKGIAPLSSINKRRRGVRGWEGVSANGCARKRLLGINLTAY